jgi:S1-C subfamily serine protease
MHPVSAVAAVRHWKPGTGVASSFLGSCFAYRWQNRILTAAHCVRGVDPSEIAVETIPNSGFLQQAIRVHFHDSADIALIEIGGLQLGGHEMTTFADIGPVQYLGSEVMAFGYPVDVLDPESNKPTPRLFKGYVQRLVSDYQPGGYKYKYDAIELNFPCPGGLSGGPVFLHGNPAQVVGLVTGNVRSTTVLDAIEEGPDRKTVYREVISYGAALRLSEVESWLAPFCPPRDDYSKPASLAQST